MNLAATPFICSKAPYECCCENYYLGAEDWLGAVGTNCLILRPHFLPAAVVQPLNIEPQNNPEGN